MTTEPSGALFDVAVVGAGPAGSATARWLAMQGWRVVLVERTRFEAPRIGESLAPNVQEPLRALGLWDEFMALRPLPSWGTRSLWGDATEQSHSHLLSPYGCGWHLDRRAFDRMLAHGAEAAGACLLEGVAVQRSVHQEGCWWLRTTPDTGRGTASQQTLRARVLIDATGRRAHVGRGLGARRMLFDRLVGVAVRWADVAPAERGHLLVEAVPEGWWYSAPLPGAAQHEDGAMIAMLMTDTDLCARSRLSGAESWQGILGSAGATKQRIAVARRVSTPQVNCAHSQRLLRECASDASPWLAVGDAALAVDPISGSGVLRALRTARAAADTVGELLARSHAVRGALAAYEAERDKECTTYLLERARYYGAEQRFDTPFWQRRQVLRRVPGDAGNPTLSAIAAAS
ncbi:NAD(P)/FAD-dependent oxidoreductase [Corallococcus sp. AB038B]|uniref:NAD(P)/FAD-dependent oxidoreductase n=1 Tax=Corallococcus sp. AB038B TaxID=2316718 RepID=UPI000ED25852|nr:NAD(P)/FAD-dependent oxidoreductase [Corallococcus sp. AB038B]RKH97027.1 NAD(P)/FAD-dependent oxidoreductase [Corallococcus sp. AB038B]